MTLLALPAMDRDVAEIADCLDEAVDEHPGRRGDRRADTRFAHALLRDEALSTIRPLRRCRGYLRFAEFSLPPVGWTPRRAGQRTC